MKSIVIALILGISLSSCGSKMMQIKTQPEYMTALNQAIQVQESQPSDKAISTELVEEFKDKDGHAFAQFKIDAIGLEPSYGTHLISYYSGYSEPINIRLTTDENGHLREILPDGTISSTPVLITVDALPASRTHLFLMSYDPEDLFVLTKNITPHPCLITTDDGAQIELSRIEKAANLVFIELKGFKPEELVTFTSLSDKEIVRPRIPTDKTGCATLILDPGVIYKKEGDASINLKRNNKQYTIKYHWSQKDWTSEDRADYKLFYRARNNARR